MARIMVSAAEVWQYAMEYENELDGGVLELIAEDEETGVEVYLSVLNEEPYVQVYMDNDLIDDVSFSDEESCIDTVSKMYDKYLSGANALMAALSGEDEEEEDAEMEIAEKLDLVDEREQELGDAVDLFLQELAPNIEEIAGDELPDIYEDVLDLVCEYLYRVRGISVYRPMFLDDDDYEEGYFTEFPYPEIDFDNED